MLDLLKNEKIVHYKILIWKNTNPRFGYHMNSIVDRKTQPVLNEYYLEFDDLKLAVDRQGYEKFNVGDKIKLSVTVSSKRIIKQEKV